MFWSKVIGEYTKEMFEERYEDGKRIQDFESRTDRDKLLPLT